MVIMALDHVRDYFNAESFLIDPTDLDKTFPALFFTRWITHYCAPVFVFLAGTSAFLITAKKDKKSTSAFLFKRGCWLIFLEISFVSLAWTFHFPHIVPFLQVIWAIGASMVLMSILIFLPPTVLFGLGLLIVAGHNSLDFLTPADFPFSGYGWMLAHEGGFIPLGKFAGLFVFYPLLPWTGIMMIGYFFGNLYANGFPQQKRIKLLRIIGGSSILLFILLRFLNIYGNPWPWEVEQNPIYTLMSFLNVQKYPPSLLYALMTLGPAFIFLSFAEQWKGKLAQVFVTFGRVPLFYYLAHLYLIHSLAMLSTLLFFPDYSPLNFIISDWDVFVKNMNGFGYSLPGTFIVWLLVIVLLYFPCKWYAAYKASNPEKWWLSYL